jgi:flagellar FliJ protein
MAFNFRLQPLLNLKEQKKEILQMELAQKTKYYMKLLGDLKVVKDQKNASMLKFDNDLKKGITSHELSFNLEVISFYNTKEISHLKTISLFEKEISQLKKKILDSHREVKIIQKLKERDMERYTAEESAQEQKQTDELTNLKYARNI